MKINRKSRELSSDLLIILRRNVILVMKCPLWFVDLTSKGLMNRVKVFVFCTRNLLELLMDLDLLLELLRLLRCLLMWCEGDTDDD